VRGTVTARLRFLILVLSGHRLFPRGNRFSLQAEGGSAMKVKNQFRVPPPHKEAWSNLNDVPRVARCAPGAELLGQNPDGSIFGAVAVRCGSAALTFNGTVTRSSLSHDPHCIEPDFRPGVEP
jgi:hypothetical protein